MPSFLNILVFNICLPKGEKKLEDDGGKGNDSLSPMEITLPVEGRVITVGVGAVAVAACLFLCTFINHPSGSSQCTSPKHPVPCIEPGLVIRFLYDILLFSDLAWLFFLPYLIKHSV